MIMIRGRLCAGEQICSAEFERTANAIAAAERLSFYSKPNSKKNVAKGPNKQQSCSISSSAAELVGPSVVHQRTVESSPEKRDSHFPDQVMFRE